MARMQTSAEFVLHLHKFEATPRDIRAGRDDAIKVACEAYRRPGFIRRRRPRERSAGPDRVRCESRRPGALGGVEDRAAVDPERDARPRSQGTSSCSGTARSTTTGSLPPARSETSAIAPTERTACTTALGSDASTSTRTCAGRTIATTLDAPSLQSCRTVTAPSAHSATPSWARAGSSRAGPRNAAISRSRARRTPRRGCRPGRARRRPSRRWRRRTRAPPPGRASPAPPWCPCARARR